METVAIRWFSLLYPTLGILLLSSGIWLLLAQRQAGEQLISWSESEQPPAMVLSILRTFLFLALPTLLLSFWISGWVELLFSIWFLAMLFILGQLLVQWKATSTAIQSQGGRLTSRIRFMGANLISLGCILLLLLYHLNTRI
ncbi:MAG: hypothetical protein ACQER4_02770 [Bacteroidota bacterium]